MTRDDLTALRRNDVTVDWRPIASAPKDGTEIICLGEFVFNAVYHHDRWMRSNCGYGFTVEEHPTHWIPMPVRELTQ